ncbi:MAG: hypothetical protein JST33_15335 [Actinobacteria bacterium]|nr:hypothetical protein [Actinomycetota bacterium]
MNLVSRIERVENDLRMRIRSRRNRHNAADALRSIEASEGALPRSIRAQADDYAADVLGSRRYAPWLYVYGAIAGEFREGWIPDDYYLSVVLSATTGRYSDLSEMRSLNTRILGHEGIPDRGYVVRGRLFSASLEPVTSLNEFIDLVFAGVDRVAFKADASSRGRGVLILDRDRFARAVAGLPDGVIQPYIDQHAAFAQVTSRSVGTLRLTTVVEPDGQIAVRAGYMRFGRDTEDHVASDSNIRVPLDIATGAFEPRGYTVKWLKIDRHPDSGFLFAGNEVPNYATCRQTVERLHGRIPLVPAIGWDLTVAHDGAVHVLEWNSGHNDIKFSEATSGPCFRGLGWEHLGRSRRGRA